MRYIRADDFHCSCANTWHTKYIMNLVLTIISAQILLGVLFYILKMYSDNIYNTVVPMLFLYLMLAGVQIYYAYMLMEYVWTLKETKCECLGKGLENLINIYSWVRMILSSFAVVTIAFSIYALLFNKTFYSAVKDMKYSDAKKMSRSRSMSLSKSRSSLSSKSSSRKTR